MTQFELAQIITKDKLIHQGIFMAPGKPTARALLWVHGLMSTFYSNIPLLEAFAEACDGEGWGFASFNNRGHDIITGMKKVDKRKAKGYSHESGGAGYERFEDCVFDIAAGVDFLVSRGFSEVVIIGHSTGANKVCYYGAKQKDSNVVGLVLAGPVSDRLDTSLDQMKMKRNLVQAREQIKKGKGDELSLDYQFFPLTARRFVSIYSPGSSEDTFDYGDEKPLLTYFSKIRKPLMVLLGGEDEYLDRTAKKTLRVFDQHSRSYWYKSVILPGALHSFTGSEKKAVDAIVEWVSTLRPDI